jgi:hypothetical protein
MPLSKDGVCKKCNNDKDKTKMYSDENNMDPKIIPNELKDLSAIE